MAVSPERHLTSVDALEPLQFRTATFKCIISLILLLQWRLLLQEALWCHGVYGDLTVGELADASIKVLRDAIGIS